MLGGSLASRGLVLLSCGPRGERDEDVGPAVEDELDGDEKADDEEAGLRPLGQDHAAQGQRDESGDQRPGVKG